MINTNETDYLITGYFPLNENGIKKATSIFYKFCIIILFAFWIFQLIGLDYPPNTNNINIYLRDKSSAGIYVFVIYLCFYYIIMHAIIAFLCHKEKYITTLQKNCYTMLLFNLLIAIHQLAGYLILSMDNREHHTVLYRSWVNHFFGLCIMTPINLILIIIWSMIYSCFKDKSNAILIPNIAPILIIASI